MKAKHAVILLALGFCTDFAAAAFKITHWRGTNELFFTAILLKIAGALLLVYKLITSRQLRGFMNH
ncbi:hypothetical protein DCC81_19495 [Chitinophaga parva]|uniref:Uncharacterized protein n=1 Tax=Chitinophaga parva TaxID=2169414 RepID=A0A2T7BBZ7_9BACT|nr:hypothetical protein [Chitinophaga parva]PUZ22621.1 hypothetical protein DCC81_19495 [Chitinophaga parva]